MNTDFVFLVGVLSLILAFPAALAGFSSSQQNFRPLIAAIVVGFVCLGYAMAKSPQGYSIADVPRIALDIVR